MNAPKQPSTLLVKLPDRTLSIYGMLLEELIGFENTITKKRPGPIVGSLSQELRDTQSS
ncbi:MAG: hypothetical protein ACSLFF_06270 [Solirubrobacterales bacterium]